MIVIVYTDRYRKGSDRFRHVAATMTEEIRERYAGDVVCQSVTRKRDLTTLFEKIAAEAQFIDEFHFIGHSGMYGPMYGTVEYPEQYSPYEWRNLKVPFAPEGKAYFHCCRSARWFVPFFARTFGVTAYGYHWYTTFSSDKKKFRKPSAASAKLYAAGCIGRKSHGLRGSLKKYTGGALETMKEFAPLSEAVDVSYDRVAPLYDAVFQDIKVRRDEWNWLNRHLGDISGKTVADIGCGNGALLRELAPLAGAVVGLDVSHGILERARALHSGVENSAFLQLTGPQLPLENQSVDVFISLLSFRYLDWDPLMDEIRRVLRPGGRVLIVDMVTVPVKWSEYPQLISSKWRHYGQRFSEKKFFANLRKLVEHPDWKHMLHYNPIRAEHEMKWYLESRFPGRKTEKINVGWNACILAFDSGSIEQIQDIHLTYP